MKPFSGNRHPIKRTPPVVLPEHVVTLTGQQVLSRYDNLIRESQYGISHLEAQPGYKGKGKQLERMRGYVDGIIRARRVITDND